MASTVVKWLITLVGEKHKLHLSLLDLKYVRQNKEMGGYVINWSANSWWLTIIITSALLYEMVTHDIVAYYRSG